MANEYRVSTFADEVLHDGAPALRVSTVAMEVLRDTVNGPTNARISTFGVEVLRSIDGSSTRRRQALVL